MDYKIDFTTMDLVLGPNGDFETVYGDEELAQKIMFRLMTTKGDYILYPNLGMSLEDFIGQPNTPITQQAIKSRIQSELLKDLTLVIPQVDVVDISDTEVLVLIEFLSSISDDRIIQISATLDLQKGNVYARSGSRTLS